ncbi:MAG TPA: cyanophycin synthetase, partial [Clostridia bacterium]|nr:cyanophycin synthetase [Clostridia bacterium]
QYVNEKTGMEAGRASVEIISSLAEGRKLDVDTIIANLKKISVESDLGPSTKAIYLEAKNRGIPVARLGNESLLQFGCGKNLRLIEASLTDSSSCISVDIAGNKHLTKDLLLSHGMPVPEGDIVYTEGAAADLAECIGYPVVVKPGSANQGKGVAVNLKNKEQVRIAYNEAIKYSKTVIVEKFIKGKDYRVLVVGDKVSAVAERRPPFLTGDGVHTIKELIDIENTNPLRGDDHESPLTKIKLDSLTINYLSEKGLYPENVPSANQVVDLRSNGNLSTGGTARDCTDEIHPYNAFIAVKAAKIIGLDIAGIDITVEDIGEPIGVENGAIVEVNAAPGLRMHLFPSEGEARNVAKDIVDMLYPDEKNYSIPIVSITGTNGKTTTTRLIRHTLALAGKITGMTSTSGVYIGDECVLKGDNTGPVSAKTVLLNKKVEVAVLETARGGIVRKGLGYDLADIGVIVNISEDHIGLDGLDTLEDLAFAKALVVEAIKPGGYSVLNADDRMAEYLMARAAGNIILFSKGADNPLVIRHMLSNGKAVYIENDSIVIFDGRKKKRLIKLTEIPITFDGLVECNIENSLAATSALYALGLQPNAIRSGLATFKPDEMTNPGRFNIFDLGDFRVMLDYSHNIAGYKAVVNFIQKMDVKRLVGVIGMPGDRLDSNIKDVGGICSQAFSKIYIKEDKDLRGRKQGEVADLLYESAVNGGVKKENIKIIHSELKALETAILDAQPGDLIIMFYEEFEAAKDLISRFKTELEGSATFEKIAEEVG